MSEQSSAPQEGSSLYYSLWGVPETQRSRTFARLTLGRTLNDALLDVTTPEVAEQKLHWWHQELERLYHGQARHPSTQACADIAGDERARDAALDILGAAADERYAPATTEAELTTRLLRSGTAQLELCIASLTSENVSPLDDTLSPLALGLAQHQRLAQLPRLLAAGQAVFATSLYQKHAIEPADLTTQEAASSAAQRALLDEAIDNARAPLMTGLDAAETAWPQNHPARPIATLARLRLQQLNAWSKRQTPLAQSSYTRPPILKLWSAWRHR